MSVTHFLTVETVYAYIIMYLIPHVNNNLRYGRNGEKVHMAGMSSQ